MYLCDGKELENQMNVRTEYVNSLEHFSSENLVTAFQSITSGPENFFGRGRDKIDS